MPFHTLTMAFWSQFQGRSCEKYSSRCREWGLCSKESGPAKHPEGQYEAEWRYKLLQPARLSLNEQVARSWPRRQRRAETGGALNHLEYQSLDKVIVLQVTSKSQVFAFKSRLKSKVLNFEFWVQYKWLALFSSFLRFTQIVNACQNFYLLLKIMLRQGDNITHFLVVCSCDSGLWWFLDQGTDSE